MEEVLFTHVLKSAASMGSSPVIFKYFDIETGLKALKQHTIVFSRPDRFNDPFDCSVELLTVDPESARKHMAVHLSGY